MSGAADGTWTGLDPSRREEAATAYLRYLAAWPPGTRRGAAWRAAADRAQRRVARAAGSVRYVRAAATVLGQLVEAGLADADDPVKGSCLTPAGAVYLKLPRGARAERWR